MGGASFDVESITEAREISALLSSTVGLHWSIVLSALLTGCFGSSAIHEPLIEHMTKSDSRLSNKCESGNRSHQPVYAVTHPALYAWHF